MWGLGVVLYSLLSGGHPFDPHGVLSDEEVVDAIEGFTRLSDARRAAHFEGADWTHVSAEAKAVVQGLMHPQASQRTSAAQLLERPCVYHL